MVDVVVIVGNEKDGELVRLAQSVDQQFCNGNATVCFSNMIPGNIGTVNHLFLVAHANISKIGDLDVSNIVSFINQFDLASTGNVFLCGCSTGNTNQQVLDNGFVAGLPLASKIREWKRDIGIYYTRSKLLRQKSDGSLRLEPSLNQGITGSETGWNIFARHT